MNAVHKMITLSIAILALVFSSAANAKKKSNFYKITITNLTKSIILTPPFVAVTRDPENLFYLGQPASDAIEAVAEGGDISALAAMLGGKDMLVNFDGPIMPATSVSRVVRASSKSYLQIASMLLPTNDAFIGANALSLRSLTREAAFLRAYDAGTENNDELCSSIPGPQCGGEGFNSAGGEGIVHPHAGIHGEGELLRSVYGWGEPVASIKVERVRRR